MGNQATTVDLCRWAVLLTRDNLLPYVRGMSEIAFYFARPLRACELIFAPVVGNIGGGKIVIHIIRGPDTILAVQLYSTVP